MIDIDDLIPCMIDMNNEFKYFFNGLLPNCCQIKSFLLYAHLV